jgi:hypothetical protein
MKAHLSKCSHACRGRARITRLSQVLNLAQALRQVASMRIEIVGDDSISRQARTYAEYRLFAALSQVVKTSDVKGASLTLRRSEPQQHCDDVVCVVDVELQGGGVARVRASGAHPYAAINRAVERLRLNLGPARHDSSRRELAARQ